MHCTLETMHSLVSDTSDSSKKMSSAYVSLSLCRVSVLSVVTGLRSLGRVPHIPPPVTDMESGGASAVIASTSQ